MAVKFILSSENSFKNMVHKDANGAFMLTLGGAISEAVKIFHTFHWGIQTIISVMLFCAAGLKIAAGVVDFWNAMKNRGIRDE